MLRELWNHADAIEKDYFVLRPEQRALPPFAAEIAGAKLLRLLGIGTAPRLMVVTSAEAAALDRRQWILKSVDGKANWTPNIDGADVRLAVAKIPGAVPLSYLRERFGIAAAIPVIDDGRTRVKLHGVLWKGKQDPPNAAELYADFKPRWWERVKIRAAIKWDSLEMLKIHTGRLFLGATCAHASNILIDSAARLYSIDHADIAKTSGDEIGLLFESVKPGTRAFNCLHLPCTLSEADMLAIFGESAPYFLSRLRRWKRLYSGALGGV